MKIEEQIAYKYLCSSMKIEYEPDGNIPPDFIMGESIGVEVRRLNQNYFDLTETEGLEQKSIPLYNIFEKIFDEYSIKYEGETYWVTVNYNRQFEMKSKQISFDIRKVLDEFLNDKSKLETEFKVNENVSIEFNNLGVRSNKIFKIGIFHDEDRGGYIVQTYIDNILLCMHEKEAKILPYRDKYLHWWLILVDLTLLGLDELDITEIKEIKSYVSVSKIFNKVLIIDKDSKVLLEI